MPQFLAPTMDGRPRQEDREVAVTAFLAQSATPAQVRDLSALGISLVVNESIEAGAAIIIELLNPRQHFWYRKTVRVLHVLPRSAEEWLVGGVFFRRFTDCELEELFHS